MSIEPDLNRPGLCTCGQRLNMHDVHYCEPYEDDDELGEQP